MGSKFQTALIAVVVSALMGAGAAGAASLITGDDIKDGSIHKRDIGKGEVSLSRLTPGVRALLAKAGTPGKSGQDGTSGVNGAKGADGTNGTAGANGTNGANGNDGATGPQGPAGTSGALPADFAFTNSSVRLTEAGVQFGRYGDGGAEGGSVRYDGLNGAKLSDIASLAYTARYSTSDGSPLGAPYLRVFLNDDTVDVVFDPTECATASPAEGVLHTFDVTAGNVRYNDDACDGIAPDQQAWSDVVADHGDDVISGVYVTTGFSGGKDARATLTKLDVNDVGFTFGG